MTSSKKIIGNYYYYINDRLGDGMTSEVYRGFGRNDCQPVAIKIVSKEQAQKAKNLQFVQSELKFLERLKGKKNVLQLHSTIRTKHNVYIITDLAQKGALNELLKQKKKLSQKTAQKYLSQIINGYKSIFEAGIIHRDLKPQNLLLNNNDEIMIADFGLSIENDKKQNQDERLAGSPYYMAPQIINSSEQQRYSIKSDIWSIGITFFQMLNGKLPWKSKNQEDFIKQVQQFNIESCMLNSLSSQSKKFLRRSLCLKVSQRMNIKELVQFSLSYFNSEDHNVPQIQTSEKMIKSQPFSSNTKAQTPKKDNLMKMFSMREEKVIETFEVSPQNNQENSCSSNNHISVKSQNSIKSQVSSPKKKIGFKEIQNFSLQQIQQEPCSEHIQQVPQKQVILKINTQKVNRQRKQSFQAPSFSSASTLEQKRKRTRKQSAEVSSNHEYLLFANKLNKQKKTQTTTNTTLEDILCSLDDDPKKVEKKTQFKPINKEFNEKVILNQLQTHIDYFRFLYKIFKKIKDVLKTNDKGIKSFKEQLLQRYNQAILETKELSITKQMSTQQKQMFKKSHHYSQLLIFLQSYQKRYDRQIIAEQKVKQIKDLKEFKKLVMYVLKILVQNVILLEQREEQLNRKKQLVFIIEDLALLNQSLLDKNSQEDKSIKKTGSISEHLNRNIPERIGITYWKSVKSQLIDLIKQ